MLNALTDLQHRSHFTDGQMARALGCSRPYWNLLRNGKRPLPDYIAVRAAGRWPELTRHLLDIAESSVTSVANTPKEVA